MCIFDLTDSTNNNPTSTSLLFFSPTHFVSVLGCFSYFLLNTCLSFSLSLSLSLSLCNGFSFPFLCLCYFSSLSHSCPLDQLWRYSLDPLTLFSLDFQFFIFCSIWFLFVCWETPGKKRRKRKKKKEKNPFENINFSVMKMERKWIVQLCTPFFQFSYYGKESVELQIFFTVWFLLTVIFWMVLFSGNALHALRRRLSDPTNVLQSWDPTLVNPCTWFHVTCDSSNHVIRL